ncbi:MAG: hypothetical protein QME85_11550 [Candidatus Saccharicenans sp.]|nr:hypothetical protein [Candidatus Saccharicenans sp.]
MKKPVSGKLTAGIFLLLVMAGSLLAQPRKYQVIATETRLHLDPDDRSPVVVSAPGDLS